MSGPEDRFSLLVRILLHLEDVLGEKAAAGLTRYAATEAAAEEAQRWRMAEGRGEPAEWLQSVLGGRVARVENEPGRIVLELRDVDALKGKGPVAEAVLVGLVKGAHAGGSHVRSMEARVEQAADGAVRVELRRANR